ncbi:hypothetical protein DXG01_007869 [Tephrocybe rancida]|nr:hypothetical protein DXG01_007869 [Tephrocybe rancida]
MKVTIALKTAALATTLNSALAYSIQDSYKGNDFFEAWTWKAINDPTHGRVNYVDKPTAQATNLSSATSNKFFMRVDSDSIVPPAAKGRDSVRIVSNKAYGDSIIVLDLQHMPAGCGTWPAFWTKSQAGPWPHGGEIDIIEGDQTVSSDCDTSVNYNQGCGTSFRKANSYGADFNSVGGGWYILERSRAKGIRVWFWARDEPFVPHAVRYGLRTIKPDFAWGWPDAHFPTSSCNYTSHFDAHEMIFDTTFCGDWAGDPSIWAASGCGPGTCAQFVDDNPEQFKEAYWEINSLRVYSDETTSDPGITIGVGVGVDVGVDVDVEAEVGLQI